MRQPKTYRYPVCSRWSLPPIYMPLSDFRALPSGFKYQWKGALPAIAGFFLGTGALWFVVLKLTDLNPSGLALILLILGTVAALALTIRLLPINAKAIEYSLMLKDREALEGPREGEGHVGLAYCDNEWLLNESASWDRGFLRVEAGCLCFRGYNSCFGLPFRQVRGVRLAAPVRFGTQEAPRIYVDWEHPEGRLNTVSLVPGGLDAKPQVCQAAEAIAAWLQEWVAEAPSLEIEPIWPFESSSLGLSHNPSRPALGSTDRWVGYATIVGPLALFFVVSVVLGVGRTIDLWGWLCHIVLPGAMAAGSYAVLRRVRKRGALNPPEQNALDGRGS